MASDPTVPAGEAEAPAPADFWHEDEPLEEWRRRVVADSPEVTSLRARVAELEAEVAGAEETAADRVQDALYWRERAEAAEQVAQARDEILGGWLRRIERTAELERLAAAAEARVAELEALQTLAENYARDAGSERDEADTLLDQANARAGAAEGAVARVRATMERMQSGEQPPVPDLMDRVDDSFESGWSAGWHAARVAALMALGIDLARLDSAGTPATPEPDDLTQPDVDVSGSRQAAAAEGGTR